MQTEPKPGKWSTPTTVDLPAAAGTPHNCGSTIGKAIIYVRSSQAFKWVLAVDASAAVTAFAASVPASHGRCDAGMVPISVIGQDPTAGLSLFVERLTGSSDTKGLSYWSEE